MAKEREKGKFKHNIGSEKGMSGSPMFVKQGKECLVAGIHHGTNPSEKFGRVIDEEVQAQIIKWRGQGKSKIEKKKKEE